MYDEQFLIPWNPLRLHLHYSPVQFLRWSVLHRSRQFEETGHALSAIAIQHHVDKKTRYYADIFNAIALSI